ncbi:histidinol-phosphate aminotransferase [Jeotgalicoccus aerolatus]|uniref:Histidinol-phosphate aminotransferase n=1 Tax=Jeotgalicoccus aerolatus TaxID=709510 RepID=A0A1G8XGA9_9STAP|nr:histidinol-phosphate transaminase [Jeotgalicoccus aerolatus]SDJ88780.1 histidinol-phosphate aminotransferase [Jeotgalicoccus aerolatus]
MISMDRNTSPKSPLSKPQITDAVNQTNIELYPEEELDRFKSLYAKRNGFKPENIEVANGSDEWLQKIVMTLGKNGVMSLSPDFVMYQVYANQAGFRYYSVPSREDYSFDYDLVINEIKSKKPSLFLISNPHNPTGVLLPSHFINDLSDAMKSVGGTLVIDEAYGEFALGHPLPQGEHIVIVRTMSKVYGLAGLRIGIAIAQGETYQSITRINHPYPLNSLSLNLGSELLKDNEQLDDWFSYQKQLQKSLVEAFETVRRHVKIKPTHTNFIFIYGSKARDLYEYLYKNGYRGRAYDEVNLKNAARFSIVHEDEYPKLKELIKKWGESHD